MKVSRENGDVAAGSKFSHTETMWFSCQKPDYWGDDSFQTCVCYIDGEVCFTDIEAWCILAIIPYFGSFYVKANNVSVFEFEQPQKKMTYERHPVLHNITFKIVSPLKVVGLPNKIASSSATITNTQLSATVGSEKIGGFGEAVLWLAAATAAQPPLPYDKASNAEITLRFSPKQGTPDSLGSFRTSAVEDLQRDYGMHDIVPAVLGSFPIRGTGTAAPWYEDLIAHVGDYFSAPCPFQGSLFQCRVVVPTQSEYFCGEEVRVAP
jgi:hypothetical protein